MDATSLQRFLSDSARLATRNEIRELLKLIAKPDIISLAGGLPAPETYPVEELQEIAQRVLRDDGAAALQYGATEGDLGLRRELIKLVEADGRTGLTADQVLVTSASQQALDREVAFVIGSAFHCDGSGQNTGRLNFSYPSVEQLRTAVQRLAEAVRSMIEEHVPVPPTRHAAERDYGEQLVADGEHSLSQLALSLSLSEILQ